MELWLTPVGASVKIAIRSGALEAGAAGGFIIPGDAAAVDPRRPSNCLKGSSKGVSDEVGSPKSRRSGGGVEGTVVVVVVAAFSFVAAAALGAFCAAVGGFFSALATDEAPNKEAANRCFSAETSACCCLRESCDVSRVCKLTDPPPPSVCVSPFVAFWLAEEVELEAEGDDEYVGFPHFFCTPSSRSLTPTSADSASVEDGILVDARWASFVYAVGSGTGTRSVVALSGIEGSNVGGGITEGFGSS